MSKASDGQIRFWAHLYLENYFKLVLFLYVSKIPIAHPVTGSWWHIATDEELDAALQSHPLVNLALDFKDSRAVAVEWDRGEGALYAAGLGVSSQDRCWIGKSARGYRIIYRRPMDFNMRSFGGKGYPIELVSTTLLLVCPSVHPTRILYSWARGHSPKDLRISDLDEPPPRLLAEWRSLGTPPQRQRKAIHYATPTPEARARLETLVLETLPNAHYVGQDQKQIAGFTDPASKSKSHVWVDVEKGCYIDWHTGHGGTIVELLKQLGCTGLPQVHRKRGRVIMEVTV